MTAAILLAGGRASRVDGAAKPLFEVAGTTLLQRAVDAVAGCVPITVVGARVDGIEGVTWAREDPPFGGPAAAVAAALHPVPADDPEWTYVLACDLPGAVAAIGRLADALPLLPRETEGLCLADEQSRPQWLIGAYRTSALRRGAARLAGGGHGASMRMLLDDVAVAVIDAPEAETADVDTWDDLAQAHRRAKEEPT